MLVGDGLEEVAFARFRFDLFAGTDLIYMVHEDRHVTERVVTTELPDDIEGASCTSTHECFPLNHIDYSRQEFAFPVADDRIYNQCVRKSYG